MFRDRTEAGERLAEALAGLRGQDAVILALPRGGLPVAAPIARALDLPLEPLLVRKVGHPGNPELALAAIAGPEGETVVLNEEIGTWAGFERAKILRLAEPERAELRRRAAAYAVGPVRLKGRTVVLVDDGIATGATVRAALEALRDEDPTRIVLAVPVAAPEALDALRPLVDEVHCLEVPRPFFAVGAHYRAFPQVSDAEVCAILAAARRA